MIRNFSLGQRVHLLLELLYSECDEKMRQVIKCSMLLSLRVQICLLSSVEFLCLAWRNDAVWFLRRMRWKAQFFLNPGTNSSSKETYGFKSTKNPTPIEELKDFEDDMLKMIQSVKFKQVNNPFLNKLKEDTDLIKNEPKLLIAADKTTNFYKLETSTYNDLLEKKNNTKSYKKAQPETTQAVRP